MGFSQSGDQKEHRELWSLIVLCVAKIFAGSWYDDPRDAKREESGSNEGINGE